MKSEIYRTVHKNDSDFGSYLWGTGHHLIDLTLALPIETLNLGTSDETVTFKVFKKSEIKSKFI